MGFFSAPLSSLGSETVFLVRLLVGIVFIYYGWPKIRNLRSNANDFVKMGFKPGWLWGTIVAVTEFVGGLSLIFGVYVWFWATGLVIHMATGTVWKIAKTDKPFTDWSYDLLLLALALMLLVTGPGVYALVL